LRPPKVRILAKYLAVTVIVAEPINSIEMPLMAIAPLTPVIVEHPHWTQLFTVLIIGLAIAFTLQLVLLTLGGAIALSVSQESPQKLSEPQAPTASRSLPISMIIGFGILATVNFVLFASSFLAVTFTQFSDLATGAIAGVVLWAAYCLLMLWFGIKAVNLVLKSFFNLSTAGLRRIFAVATSPFKPEKLDEPITQAQLEAIVQQEIQAGLQTLQLQLKAEMAELEARSPSVSNEQNQFPSQVQDVWQQLQTYLKDANPELLTPKKLDRFITEALYPLAQNLSIALPDLDQQELRNILTVRGDLSEKKKKRIFEQISTAWDSYKQSTLRNHPEIDNAQNSEPSNGETLQTVVKTAVAPIAASLTSPELTQHIEQLIKQTPLPTTDLNQVLVQAEQLRDRTTTQLSNLQQMIQSGIQTRLTALQQDAQARLEATRKTVATAAWWSFATVCTGGISAALAGAIAVGMRSF